MKDYLYICLGTAVLILAWAIESKLNSAEQSMTTRDYCELSSMWLDDAARGVDVYDRRGHPPYKREIDCRVFSAGEQGK
jgi:hypothetical protein